MQKEENVKEGSFHFTARYGLFWGIVAAGLFILIMGFVSDLDKSKAAITVLVFLLTGLGWSAVLQRVYQATRHRRS